VQRKDGAFMKKADFTVVPVRSSLHDEAAVLGVLDSYRPLLADMGISIEERPIPEDGPLIVFVLTGGTEKRIIELALSGDREKYAAPVLLIAHPDSNSLPAALEALARLEQEDVRGRVFFINPEDKAGLASLKEALHFYRVRKKLQNAHIGFVGGPSDWLVASSPDSSLVSRVWGPAVEWVGLDELYREMDAREGEADASSAPGMFREIVQGAGSIVEPSDRDIKDADGVYEALRRIVKKRGFNAVTLKCFDLVVERSTTGCMALSLLSGSGIPAGCEGDLPSLVGLLWGFYLTGETGWMANPARINEESGALTLAHCTVPLNLVRKYKLRSHFESGLGVGIEGDIVDGPVTLFRIGGRGLDQVWITEGAKEGSGREPSLCRTQVHVKVESEALRELLKHPLGNHLVLLPGRYSHTLNAYHRQYIAPR